jgi:hypothetical protein
MALTARNKRLAADFFFALQIALALISGGSQFIRLLTTSQGVNLSWLASWLAFLLINLTLILRGEGPGKSCQFMDLGSGPYFLTGRCIK